MKKRKSAKKVLLKHHVTIRIGEEKFNELKKLLDGNSQNDMSRLLRDILHNKPITVFTKDKTLDNLMEELAKLRSEIRAIGVNINQITRLFNTYPEPQRKALFAKMAFKEHQALEPKITALLEIVSKLAKRWLSD
ncbi:MAG TPA: plasmid mobilization relaxosome protein MobC [Patescibacteria group bacterium]